MDLLTPLITGALLALFTGIQTWINKGRMDALEERIDRRFDQVDRRFEHVDRRFEQLSAEIASLRSDLLQVALAANPRHESA